MNIGENIKKYRKEKKLTQAQLSELCGVPAISLGRYERGERNPNIDTLTKIATVLQVPIDILCGLKLEPFIEPTEGLILGYTNEKGELTFDSTEEYIQSEMAKELVDNEFYTMVNSLKTFLTYVGSSLELTWYIQDDEVKIKLTNNKFNSKLLNYDETIEFMRKIMFHIKAEADYIFFSDTSKELKEAIKNNSKVK